MRISKAAFDLIVAEEVSSKQRYESKYRHPEWPGVKSGVTIGIGYDIGYHREDEVRRDWGGIISDGMIDDLVACCGIRGSAARDLLPSVKSVDVPWDAAIEVFKNKSVKKWEKVVAALPNSDKLHPDCFGALVSLAFNRGTSWDDQTGDKRYAEMRAIKQHMKAGNFDAIPDEIRAMKRIWPGVTGLQKRRDREADLFERGLRAQEDAPAPLPPPPDIEPPEEPATKPAAKSWINWAAIASFLASVGGFLTDWRVLTVIVVGLLAAFIIWNRSGKPDIRGWFRS